MDRYCHRCTEAGILAAAGECLEVIAARLTPPMKPENLRTHLQRHGRGDLADAIPRLADARPSAWGN